ncbi:hypothetical protein [Streptomyces sp. NPDC059010]|uniref:hypothetical protein n=1 Tax=Streptomyces sp. NPDC059010 TaxID=3346695 RepID=UPI00368203A7
MPPHPNRCGSTARVAAIAKRLRNKPSASEAKSPIETYNRPSGTVVRLSASKVFWFSIRSTPLADVLLSFQLTGPIMRTVVSAMYTAVPKGSPINREKPVGRPVSTSRFRRELLGDKGYDSNPNRRSLRSRRILSVISRKGAPDIKDLGRLGG